MAWDSEDDMPCDETPLPHREIDNSDAALQTLLGFAAIITSDKLGAFTLADLFSEARELAGPDYVLDEERARPLLIADGCVVAVPGTNHYRLA